MATRILIYNGERKAIAKLLNTSTVTVWHALSGHEPVTIFRHKIRKIAIDRGGVEVTPKDNNR